jgi:hypothetical protein
MGTAQVIFAGGRAWIAGQNAPLWRIWCNFWLRMRIIYFRTGHVTDVTSDHVTDITSGRVANATSGHMTDVTSGHVTSGHVTSGSTSQHLRNCDLSCPHILLMSLPDETPVSSGKCATESCAISALVGPFGRK